MKNDKTSEEIASERAPDENERAEAWNPVAKDISGRISRYNKYSDKSIENEINSLPSDHPQRKELEDAFEKARKESSD